MRCLYSVVNTVSVQWRGLSLSLSLTPLSAERAGQQQEEARTSWYLLAWRVLGVF
jgi:hypothetical protein